MSAPRKIPATALGGGRGDGTQVLACDPHGGRVLVRRGACPLDACEPCAPPADATAPPAIEALPPPSPEHLAAWAALGALSAPTPPRRDDGTRCHRCGGPAYTGLGTGGPPECLAPRCEVGVMDNEITDKGGTVDMMQDGPLVAGWEVWFVEGGGERWWLLVKPGEDVRAAMRVSGNWDDEAHITEDAAGARRWTFHESLTMTVRVEDHPTIRMTLAEAAETQACDAARHDHCRVIATTCW